jgi:SpoU rRNA methylase family enzyme
MAAITDARSLQYKVSPEVLYSSGLTDNLKVLSPFEGIVVLNGNQGIQYIDLGTSVSHHAGTYFTLSVTAALEGKKGGVFQCIDLLPICMTSM